MVATMLQLIIAIAVIGLLIWAITTYIPMEPIFKGFIILIGILVVVFALFGGGSFGGCGTGLNLRHGIF